MMSRLLSLIVFFISILFTGCATLFGKTSYLVKVNSVPREATVTVYNRQGKEILTDTTPCVIRLKSHAGYFRRGIYTLEFSKPGYDRSTEAVIAKINPWYYGNILLGGYIGFLVLDPLTGAMYRINTREINQILHSTNNNRHVRLGN